MRANHDATAGPVFFMMPCIGTMLDLPQVDPEVSEAAWREIDLFRSQEYTSD